MWIARFKCFLPINPFGHRVSEMSSTGTTRGDVDAVLSALMLKHRRERAAAVVVFNIIVGFCDAREKILHESMMTWHVECQEQVMNVRRSKYRVLYMKQ